MSAAATATPPAAGAAAAPPPVDPNVVIPALREDLVISKQMFEGRTYYVIKDPISLQYFRLGAEDYYLATLFDGKRTFAKVREAYLREFPHLKLEYSDEEITERVQRFANDLALMQFLGIQGMRLKARYEAVRQRKLKKGLFANLVNKLFFYRFSLLDPDAIFGRMARPVWWIWTRTTAWVSIFLTVAALIVFMANYQRIAPSMSEFFALQNLLLVWVLTILVKSIHELGHGLTCKHFRGEVHEVGVMILVFTPYFFVNVTDSWVMPKRMHRILISFAGIYVELILAALATFAWAVIQPGLLQQSLFNVMVIASISTIIFNANPLMRFDGYYIMTDLLEVPNLMAKSRALIGHQVKRLLFGRNVQDPVLARMPLPKKRFWLFYIYAVLSWVYGYYIIYALTTFMSARLEPYGLKTLGVWLSISALLAWVVYPFYMFFKGMEFNRHDWKPHGRLRRLTFVLGTATVAFAVLCFFPFELEIKRAVAIELAEPEAVRPEIPGFIAEVLVKEGDRVAAGGVLAKLTNREAEARYQAAQQRVKIGDALIVRAMGLDKPAELRAAEGERAQAQTVLDDARRDVERLTLRSLTGGTVLSRELARRQGMLLKTGELFCEIAPLEVMRIKVPLTEHQVRYVEKGQRVLLKAYAYPEKTLHGVIAANPLMFIGKDMPPALSAFRKGDVPTGVDTEGKEVPTERTFIAEIELDNREGLLRQGMTGRAKIFAGKHTFGRLVLQSILDLVSLDYRF